MTNSGTGSIAGKVTNASGVALPDISVEVFDQEWNYLGSATTSSAGVYSLTGLANVPCLVGTYSGARNYVDEWYDNVVRAGNWDAAGATLVDLRATGSRTGIDFKLSTGRKISGKVTKAGGAAIEGISVEVINADTREYANSVITSAGGDFAMVGLPAGRYAVRTYHDDLNYVDEWYDNVTVTGDQSFYSATVLDLSTATSRSNVNFGLATGRIVAGTVLDSQGHAIQDVEVDICDSSSLDSVGYAQTRTDGSYRFVGLPAGRYVVRTWNNGLNYVDEWYKNVIAAGNREAAGATVLDMRATTSRSGVNFGLATGKIISGRVTNSGGTALTGFGVSVREAEQLDDIGWGQTNASGVYRVAGLPVGRYMVRTNNGNQNYVDEWYKNVIAAGNFEAAGAAPVILASANQMSINFSLAAGKVVSGRVTGSTGAPLADMSIGAYDLNGNYYAGIWIDAGDNGSYVLRGLPAGRYRLRTWNENGYVDEWYDNLPVIPTDYMGTGAATVDLRTANAGGKNFKLALGRKISGKVTGPGGAPLAGVEIDLYYAPNKSILHDYRVITDSSGKYAIDGLYAGKYYVGTWNSKGYVDEWYGPGHATCAGHLDMSGASIVNLATANATAIDFDLLRGYRIKGKLTDYTTGFALSRWMGIHVVDATGRLYARVYPGGGVSAYSTWSLPPGTYYAKTVDVGYGYKEQWYLNLWCLTHGIGDATPIQISSADKTGVDFKTKKLPRTEQTDSHIYYVGTWSKVTTGLASGSSYAAAKTSGSYATIYFNGIRLDWIGLVGPDAGKADVFVDGALKATVNLNSPSAAYQQLVWSTGDLAPGKHKVRIKWNTSSAAGKYIALDAVAVDGAFISPY